MSLIGSEVNVTGNTAMDEQPMAEIPHMEIEPERVINGGINEDHSQIAPPVSPPRPAERIFLSDLTSQNISASELSDKIHQSGSTSSKQSRRSYIHRTRTVNISISTDSSASDWASASGRDDDSLWSKSDATPKLHPSSTRSSDTLSTPLSSTDTDEEESAYEKFFKKDVLSRKIRDLSEVDEDTYLDSDYTTPSSSSAMSTPSKFFPAEAPQHVDAVEKVYDTAKGVWAWGKGVVVFKPFLGVTEAFAGKVADMMGSDLASIDGIVIDKIHDLDDSMLNPAIAAVLNVLLGAAGKTEDIVKPLIVAILKPLGLIKETPENPEMTPVPGVTTVVQ